MLLRIRSLFLLQDGIQNLIQRGASIPTMPCGCSIPFFMERRCPCGADWLRRALSVQKCSWNLSEYISPGLPRSKAGVELDFVDHTAQAMRFDMSCSCLLVCVLAAVLNFLAMPRAASPSRGSVSGPCSTGIIKSCNFPQGKVKGGMSGSLSDEFPSLLLSRSPVGPDAAIVCNKNVLMRVAADTLTTLPWTYSLQASGHCT